MFDSKCHCMPACSHDVAFLIKIFKQDLDEIYDETHGQNSRPHNQAFGSVERAARDCRVAEVLGQNCCPRRLPTGSGHMLYKMDSLIQTPSTDSVVQDLYHQLGSTKPH